MGNSFLLDPTSDLTTVIWVAIIFVVIMIGVKIEQAKAKKEEAEMFRKLERIDIGGRKRSKQLRIGKSGLHDTVTL